MLDSLFVVYFDTQGYGGGGTAIFLESAICLTTEKAK
jgi:hypothetical protein